MNNRATVRRNFSIALEIVLFTLFLSCEEFVVVPPPSTEIIREDMFEGDATALAAISAVYGQLISGEGSFVGGGASIIEGVYADELISFVPLNSPQPFSPFYLNTVVPSNSFVSTTWGTFYNCIYSANLIIEGLTKPNGVSISVKNQLMGEALFIRAFCHFYLVNLYGDVPTVKTSDYRINAHVSRIPVSQVYDGIIVDLLEAKNLLVDKYPSVGRLRVNRGAVMALLARTYLYKGDFPNAESEATEVIKLPQYKLLQDLNTVFLKTSEEAIWQISRPTTYTFEGFKQILVAAPPANVTLRDELYNSFEIGDLRKTNWTKSLTSPSGFSTWYYAFKYKENHLNATDSECSMVLRLAEQYLIRAEARAQQNNLTGPNSAESDINIIRIRAGLTNTSAASKIELLTAIEHERRMEFFTEWGHRFFDLRRTGRLDEIMSTVKSSWRSHYALFPIPESEILINPNLRPQNSGY